MKATGIVRRIDDLGRVVIPKEIRRTMRIREGDPLEIYTDKDGGVIFKKYSMLSGLSDLSEQLCETLSRTTGHIAVITDRDSCLSIAGVSKREVVDKPLSTDLERVMEGRSIYQHKAGEKVVCLCTGECNLSVSIAAPILSEGDVMGCVIFATEDKAHECGEVEQKLAQSIAAFLGRHLEG